MNSGLFRWNTYFSAAASDVDVDADAVTRSGQNEDQDRGQDQDRDEENAENEISGGHSCNNGTNADTCTHEGESTGLINPFSTFAATRLIADAVLPY